MRKTGFEASFFVETLAHDHDHQNDPPSKDRGSRDGHEGHAHGSATYGLAFAVGITLNSLFVVVEVVYGLLSGSMALVADAGHNLSDVAGLILAWWAVHLSKRAPTKRRTYGFRRSSILAALGNAVLLLVMTGGVLWEAVLRIRNPAPVEGFTMIAVASAGVVVNVGSALMFVAGRKHDLNVHAAFLHLSADAAVSLGVVVTGVVLLRTGWTLLDPLASVAISIVVLASTWGVLRKSLDLAMDAVPESIDPEAVEAYLRAVPDVAEVHDLHIWAMSTTETALTVHLVLRPSVAVSMTVLREVEAALNERFGIRHVTAQMELPDETAPCPLAPSDIV